MNINYLARLLYEAKSKYKLANNILLFNQGLISPQQLLYESSKDEIIKHIIFGR